MKVNLALNYLQYLICHKTKPNQSNAVQQMQTNNYFYKKCFQSKLLSLYTWYIRILTSVPDSLIFRQCNELFSVVSIGSHLIMERSQKPPIVVSKYG